MITCVITCDFGACSCGIFVRERWLSAPSFVAIITSDSMPYVLLAPTVAAAVTLSYNNGCQNNPTLGHEGAFVLGPGATVFIHQDEF